MEHNNNNSKVGGLSFVPFKYFQQRVKFKWGKIVALAGSPALTKITESQGQAQPRFIGALETKKEKIYLAFTPGRGNLLRRNVAPSRKTALADPPGCICRPNGKDRGASGTPVFPPEPRCSFAPSVKSKISSQLGGRFEEKMVAPSMLILVRNILKTVGVL
jgi:hypothetical protein